MKLRCLLALVVLVAVGVLPSQGALAWDPATTHAGLTERALEASKLHATLAHELGRPLGSLEPLRLDANTLDADVARELKNRLHALDSAGGYRPSAEGVATASAWVRAGAVLAKTPPERGRHHFLEPQTRTGLDDGPGLSGTLYALRLTLDDGATVRECATGEAFDLEGRSSLEWLRSPRNDLGLNAFFDNWVLAVSAPRAGQRETALARALLAMGGVLSLLEDAGQPAFVRNDFRGEFLTHDSGSALERFVADRYGSVALPRAQAPVARPDLDSYFVAADGNGLAQATQRRFFSPGTLPQDFRCDPVQTPSELAVEANRSLRFSEPKVMPLDVRYAGRTRYVVRDGARVLAYQRNGDRLHFFLDQAVEEDLAAQWLPKVEGYAAGMIDYLLRAKVQIVLEGDKAEATLIGVVAPFETGALWHLYSEDESGVRTELPNPGRRQRKSVIRGAQGRAQGRGLRTRARWRGDFRRRRRGAHSVAPTTLCLPGTSRRERDIPRKTVTWHTDVFRGGELSGKRLHAIAFVVARTQEYPCEKCSRSSLVTLEFMCQTSLFLSLRQLGF